jgi:hypothetical protein
VPGKAARGGKVSREKPVVECFACARVKVCLLHHLTHTHTHSPEALDVSLCGCKVDGGSAVAVPHVVHALHLSEEQLHAL